MSPSDASSQFSRACDRCRRKKVKVSGSWLRSCGFRLADTALKCDSVEGSCSGCHKAGQSCSFLIPPGKRGPKGKPRPRISAGDSQPLRDAPQSSTSPLAEQLHNHTPLYLDSYHNPTPHERWKRLSAAVIEAAPSKALGSVLQVCTDLFFDYLYLFTPVINEAAFRHLLDRVLCSASPGSCLTEPEFTLITAVCAKACFFLPSDMIPEGKLLAEPLLDASRACMYSYSDTDLENPTADSIITRYLHSNCLHTSARPWVSWQVFGDVIRLVQQMRLHDERTYASMDRAQADACRRAFWLVYIGDKSMSVLRRMPITLHDYAFEEGISAEFPSNEDERLRKKRSDMWYID